MRIIRLSGNYTIIGEIDFAAIPGTAAVTPIGRDAPAINITALPPVTADTLNEDAVCAFTGCGDVCATVNSDSPAILCRATIAAFPTPTAPITIYIPTVAALAAVGLPEDANR
jgi:hypothetical protein